MKIRLGIDVACRAARQASCADEHGVMLWVGHRFHTDPDELEALWRKLPEGATEVMVVMEPTRNAWVALAAWFRRHGATVVMVPPEQSADLHAYYNKHAKTDRLDSTMLARLPLLHPEGCTARTPSVPATPQTRGQGPLRTGAPADHLDGPTGRAAGDPGTDLGRRARQRHVADRAAFPGPLRRPAQGQATAAPGWRTSSAGRAAARGTTSGPPRSSRPPTRPFGCGVWTGWTSTPAPPTSPRRPGWRSPSARRSSCWTSGSPGLPAGRPHRDRPVRSRRRPGRRPADHRPARGRHPVRQPLRDPLLRRPGAPPGLLRKSRPRRRPDQGRRRLPARGAVHGSRPRPTDRPDPGRPLPPADH